MVTGRHGVGHKACAVGVRLARLSVAPHTPAEGRYLQKGEGPTLLKVGATVLLPSSVRPSMLTKSRRMCGRSTGEHRVAWKKGGEQAAAVRMLVAHGCASEA